MAIIKWEEANINRYVSTITWSGSATQAARMLEFSLINANYDTGICPPNIKLGDTIRLFDDEKTILFYGIVTARERASNTETITYTAYDSLNYLLKSNWTHKFKNTTPEKITKLVCEDLQIKTGEIAVTNVPIKKMIVEGESYYNIIMKAYTKAFKVNKQKYMLRMNGDKLCVVKKGALVSEFRLEEKKNITASSYSENLDSMINKVKIYNQKGKQVGEVKKENWIHRYGIFQEVYTKEKGTDAKKVANNLLNGIEKSASIEALGDTTCISGNAVKIKDASTGLIGKFWIESDSHTWENGVHMMSLELAFQNLMETMDEDENGTIQDEDINTTGERTFQVYQEKAKSDSLNKTSKVWATLSGERYHASLNCGNLKDTKSITIEAAEKLGKTPCKRCIK